MLNFLKSFFMPPPPSGALAKERLRLVLLSDHLSLAPEVVENLKRDLLEVISRYVEIDSENADVTFEHREREVAMLASIPITGVRERRAAPDGPPESPGAVTGNAVPAEDPRTVTAEADAQVETDAAEAPQARAGADSEVPEETETSADAVAARPAAIEAASPSSASAEPAQQCSPQRRRRRKKSRAPGVPSLGAPAPARA